jgi:GTP-binding protein Era
MGVLTRFANSCNERVDFGGGRDRRPYLWPVMLRTGNVALVGRTNVGKSTFLNNALGEPLAIVSALPQTTRDTLLGVVAWHNAEIALFDNPGFHNSRNELGRRMNASALDSLHHADLVLVLTDVLHLLRKPGSRGKKPYTPSSRILEEDRRILAEVPEDTPCVIVVNKIDLLSDKSALLPLLSELGACRPASPIVPISCLLRLDVERVLETLAPLLPLGSPRHSSDTLTDRPVRYFIAEYIREQIMRTTRGEIPFAVAVTLDEFSELQTSTLIKATISVEKDGQRIILIGRRGRQIREIGIMSRQRIELFLQKKVHLEIFVRTNNHWRDSRGQMAGLGYTNAESGESTLVAAAHRRGRP